MLSLFSFGIVLLFFCKGFCFLHEVFFQAFFIQKIQFFLKKIFFDVFSTGFFPMFVFSKELFFKRIF